MLTGGSLIGLSNRRDDQSERRWLTTGNDATQTDGKPIRLLAVQHQGQHPMPETTSGLTLAGVLLGGSGLFVLATLFFGTKGGYYDTDKYDGNGTAH